MKPTPFAEQYQHLLGRNDHLPEATFLAPFHEFTLQFNSLQRYWALMNAHQQRITSELDAWPTDGQEEQELLRSETVDVDQLAFPHYLRHSVLGMALALAEDLLNRLSGHPSDDAAYSGPSLNAPFMANLSHRLRQLQGTSLGDAPKQEQPVVQAPPRASVGSPAMTLLDDLIALVDQLAVEAKAEGAALTAEDVDVTLDHLSKLVKACEQGMNTQLER